MESNEAIIITGKYFFIFSLYGALSLVFYKVVSNIAGILGMETHSVLLVTLWMKPQGMLTVEDFANWSL